MEIRLCYYLKTVYYVQQINNSINFNPFPFHSRSKISKTKFFFKADRYSADPAINALQEIYIQSGSEFKLT